jgi:hypothetical protein
VNMRSHSTEKSVLVRGSNQVVEFASGSLVTAWLMSPAIKNKKTNIAQFCIHAFLHGFGQSVKTNNLITMTRL